LIKTKDRIYPVGRLDYDTTGLLFLTNDGDFSQLLTHPKNKVPREYDVKLDKQVSEEDKKSLLNGINLDGKKGKFIDLSFPNSRDKKNVTLICEEGRNRFVKRMFGRLGYRVINLTRTSFADIRIDIPTGKYRNLTPQEVNFIKEKFSTDS
jgi:23S rRNA pseudouridine2605 synthase